MKLIQQKVKMPSGSSSASMEFSPQDDAAIRIKEVLFYPWVDTGGVYDVEGRPRVELRDLFRRLNHSAP